jgi:hypothetical protein
MKEENQRRKYQLEISKRRRLISAWQCRRNIESIEIIMEARKKENNVGISGSWRNGISSMEAAPMGSAKANEIMKYQRYQRTMKYQRNEKRKCRK